MKRVGIYLRVSTEEQVRIQDGSLVSQKQRLIEFVELQNARSDSAWGVVVDFYCDEGKSAKDMNRPEFQRMLTDVKSKRINLIVATELSRLSRNIRDFCEVWDLFKKHEASFITLRDHFDTTTAAGELMMFNMINYAQYERKQTAERIAANWQSRAKRGLWNGGSIPFGFDRNDKNKAELLPHETESKQVKEIFELFLQEGSVRRTCLAMTARGIFAKAYTNKHGIAKAGRQITFSGLQRILTNRAYVGIREIGVSRGKKLELVKAAWKPLISDDLFQQVQERLHLNKNKMKPYERKNYAFPLTEILVCGECGKHLGGKSGTSQTGDKHFYYGHPRQLKNDGVNHIRRCKLESVRVEKIEEIVLKSLKKLLTDEKLIDHFLDIYLKGNQSNLPALKGKIKTIENDILTLERRNQNLVERLSELPKEIAADQLYGQMKINSDQVVTLKTSLASLKAEEYQTGHQDVSRDGLLFKIKRTVQNLEKAPIEKHKAIYGSLIKFAELHSTKVRMGVYAPVLNQTLETKKAAGYPSAASINLFEPSHQVMRVGSSTVLNGAPEKT